jgi:hypothetical protein
MNIESLEEIEFIERLIKFYWTEWNENIIENKRDFELSKIILEKIKTRNDEL